MPTLLEQARDLKTVIDAETATAKTKWATFDALRKSAVAEGVDFTKNADAFDKLDAAGKDYDEARDSIAAKQSQWQRLLDLANADNPDAKTPASLVPSPREPEGKSLGELFVASAEYLECKDRFKAPGDMRFGDSRPVTVASRAQLKTLLTSAGVGAFIQNDQAGVLVPLPTAPLSLLDVISFGSTDSDTVEWQQEKTWTNAAAETAEGDAAPESTLEYETITTTVQDITHFLPSTKRALADAGQAATLIDNRLTGGVRVRLQNQIVNGDGLGVNLKGMLNTANILTQALGADSRSDAIHKGITKIRIAGLGSYEPGFVGIHPSDWEQVALEKNAGGDYYFGGPAGNGAATVWGLRPIISTVFAAGTGLVFDANQVQGWLNGGLDVAMSDSHSDYFVKKKVAVMASVRAAFGVYAPGGLCTVTGI